MVCKCTYYMYHIHTCISYGSFPHTLLLLLLSLIICDFIFFSILPIVFCVPKAFMHAHKFLCFSDESSFPILPQPSSNVRHGERGKRRKTYRKQKDIFSECFAFLFLQFRGSDSTGVRFGCCAQEGKIGRREGGRVEEEKNERTVQWEKMATNHQVRQI